jgi:hypothetical protein
MLSISYQKVINNRQEPLSAPTDGKFLMKKPNFISFRPSDLAESLIKRGASDEMSGVAKLMLGRHLRLLDLEQEKIRASFSSPEMQVVVAAVYEAADDPMQIPQVVTESVRKAGYVREIARRYSVDADGLIAKMQSLSAGGLFAIHDAVLQFKQLPFGESMGLNGFPAPGALRRVGLLEVEGAAAWGLCVVRLSNYASHELVLHRNPLDLSLGSTSLTVDELAQRLIGCVKVSAVGKIRPEQDVVQFSLAYRLAIAKQLRYFRVQEDEAGNISTVEIKREHLISDMHDGSSEGLVLQGINAPETADWPAEATVRHGANKISLRKQSKKPIEK